LAQLGADVAIIDIDLSVAVRHGEVLTAADVMEEVKALGRAGIDILVNNAGGALTPIDRSRPSESPFEDTEKLFAVNFYSMVHCCRAPPVAEIAAISSSSRRRRATRGGHREK
jgi:NAD(P)-dependent dehydrogenase (short-subunit alcohol dehydrogenase family)